MTNSLAETRLRLYLTKLYLTIWVHVLIHGSNPKKRKQCSHVVCNNDSKTHWGPPIHGCLHWPWENSNHNQQRPLSPLVLKLSTYLPTSSRCARLLPRDPSQIVPMIPMISMIPSHLYRADHLHRTLRCFLEAGEVRMANKDLCTA